MIAIFSYCALEFLPVNIADFCCFPQMRGQRPLRYTHGTYTPYMVAGWRVNRTNGASAHEAYPTLRMFFFNNQCQIELHDFWKFRPFGCLRSLIAMGVTTRNPPIGLHQGACDTTRSGFGAWRTASGGLIW